MQARRRDNREREHRDLAHWTAYGRIIRELDDEDDEEEEEFERSRRLNPPRKTFYLGRGRRGDNSRLHRGIMLFRDRERDRDRD